MDATKPRPGGALGLALALAAVVLGLDQASKWVILTQIMAPPRVVEVTGFFNLVLTYNTGVSFGLFGGAATAWKPWALGGLALAVSAGLLYWLARQPERLLGLAVGLIVGGALGNALDRAHQPGVVDFMDFYLADGQSLVPLLDHAPVITDDRPVLEHSPATLVPPLKRDTDETFLNLLQFRMGQFPPVRGISQDEVYFFQRNYEMRTAQRISIFSQRYQGPGAEAFAGKQYRAGLEQVQIFLDTRRGPFIRLSDSGWQ